MTKIITPSTEVITGCPLAVSHNNLYGEQKTALYNCMMHVLGYGASQYHVFRASAGTGKSFTASTLINFAKASGIIITPIAFTGRAASRIGASTCHSLLYEPILDADGNLIRWSRKPTSAIRESVGNAILIDEGSMIPYKMFQEISDIGVPIIILGDDSQLDPVDPENENGTFNLMIDLDVEVSTLYDMRRFNPDSGIAKVAERLREDNVIRKIKSDDVVYTSKKRINSDFYRQNDIDVTIVGSNATRKRLTRLYRDGNDWDCHGLPSMGEVVMCLRNDVINGTKIYNGELYTVVFAGAGSDRGRYMLNCPIRNITITIDILHETWETERAPSGAKNKLGCFTFGYVMTAFKAQGSTFNNVLFYDEDVSFFTNQRKYRYTGITRAANKLWLTV